MLRTVITSLVAVLLVVPAVAQPDLDWCEGFYQRPDGYRIFFDASVLAECGGAINDPGAFFWQTESEIEAWLVLVDPTAATLGGFRIGRELLGDHVDLVAEVLGEPFSVQIVDDIMFVEYDPPLTLDGSSVLLVHWSFSNLFVIPVEFYLWPAPGDAMPLYLDGAGDTVRANTFNGTYTHFQAPVAILNGSVTPNDSVTWSSVKALYR